MVKAEFFDIFGFMGFVILIGIAIWMLKSIEKLPNWTIIIILIIATIGAIVDGHIIFKTYITRS